jgi:hypothetical protein
MSGLAPIAIARSPLLPVYRPAQDGLAAPTPARVQPVQSFNNDPALQRRQPASV